MLITKVSVLTNNTNTMDIPVTQEEIDNWKNSGRMIQDVFPHLTAGQREFLLSGSTDEEWDEAFGE